MQRVAFVSSILPTLGTKRTRGTGVTCSLWKRPPDNGRQQEPQPQAPQQQVPSLQLLLDSTKRLVDTSNDAANDAADAAQALFVSAMSALGVSNSAPDAADVDDVGVPTEPPFDPVQAHMLAGYAFRAYEDPSPHWYREVHETPVYSDAGEAQQAIVAHYVYPDANVLGRAIEGLFLFKFEVCEKKGNLPKLFFVARVNESVRLQILSEPQFTLLRRRDARPRIDAELDELVVLAFENETAFYEGRPPVLRGSSSLTGIVQRGNRWWNSDTRETFEMKLKPVDTSLLSPDFFDISQLPEEWQTSFFKLERAAQKFVSPTEVEMSVDVQYSKPDKSITEQKKSKRRDEKTAEQNIYGKDSALQRALTEKIPVGQVAPFSTHWATLARGARELADELDVNSSKGDRKLVREDIPKSLFVQSTATDTEVWLFHDEENGDLVISFRGTEQDSWKDFAVDAQLFLQRWEPGGDIDLTVNEANSVGLATVTEMVQSSVRLPELPELPDLPDLPELKNPFKTSKPEPPPSNTMSNAFPAVSEVVQSKVRLPEIPNPFKSSTSDEPPPSNEESNAFPTVSEVVQNKVRLPEIPNPFKSSTSDETTEKETAPVMKGVADDDSCVHYGFLRAYESVRDSVQHAILMLTGGQLRAHRFHFTGHSLGGALATLCAGDFAFHYPHVRNNVVCVSYGAPKVGNAGFASRYNQLVSASFRVVNDSDIVVRMPKSIGARPCERYRHTGRTVLVNDQGEIWVEGESDCDKMADPFRERYTDGNKLVEYEREMWNKLVSGQSLKHHCEDSYFLAMTEVLRRATL